MVTQIAPARSVLEFDSFTGNFQMAPGSDGAPIFSLLSPGQTFRLRGGDTSSSIAVYLGTGTQVIGEGFLHSVAAVNVSSAAISPFISEFHAGGKDRNTSKPTWSLTTTTVASEGTGYSWAITSEHLQLLNKEYPQQPLFFQAQASYGWKRDTDEYTYSPIWGLADSSPVAASMYQSPAFTFSTSAYSQTASGVFSVATQPAGAVTASTATPSDATATSTSTSTSSSTPSPSSNATTSGNARALSTGAVVGVVIGGVALLALVTIAAILCLRSRRRRRNAGTQGAHDLMAEKEARGAGIVPDTPYSEASLSQRLGMSGLDGSTASMHRGGGGGGETSQRGSTVYSPLRNVTTVGTGAGRTSEPGDSPTDTHPSSSISLDDEPVSPAQDAENETDQAPLAPPGGAYGEGSGAHTGSTTTGTPQFVPPRLGRSDTPGGVSISDYLHEDGMTEEEIRRLEEEERALDEAIERARTDGRAGAGGTRNFA